MNTGGLLARRAFIGGLGLALAGIRSALAQAAGSINERMQGDFAPVHDPCIIKQGDTYYVFSTSVKTDTAGFIACRRSRDLVSWERAGFVFKQIPQWARDAVPRTKGIWAPDISLFNGLYHLYYSVSSFGSNHSVIGLATNKTLDPAAPGFEWVDRGLVVRSRQQDDYNAIDPNLVVDRDGKHWLSWGSFWSGLKMARIDPATGKLMKDATILSLASRPAARGEPSPIEAPFIISHGDFYYLFASFDFCCRGAKSNYSSLAAARARSPDPTSTYNGRSMLDGGGSVVLQGNERFKGPDTMPCCTTANATSSCITPTTRSRRHAKLRISPIDWTPDGWPRAQL